MIENSHHFTDVVGDSTPLTLNINNNKENHAATPETSPKKSNRFMDKAKKDGKSGKSDDGAEMKKAEEEELRKLASKILRSNGKILAEEYEIAKNLLRAREICAKTGWYKFLSSVGMNNKRAERLMAVAREFDPTTLSALNIKSMTCNHSA